MMTQILNTATILSIGLMIGVEFAVSAFINPILWKLEEPARGRVVALFAQRLGTAMPFWYAANFLFLLAGIFLLRGHDEIWPIGIAAALWAAVIILTLIFLVPINNRLAHQDAELSLDEAHRQHRRWDAMHRARVAALAAAFVLLLAALRP
jgi:uncharacterized membrane protein